MASGAFGAGPFGAGPFGVGAGGQPAPAPAGPAAPAGRPAVTELTELVYGLLPEVYQQADQRFGDWPLLTYLSGLTDTLDKVRDLYDRVDYSPVQEGGDGSSSQLADPARADPAWLGWLAQHVGVDLDTTMPIPAQRDAVASAASGWQVGSKRALADAARSALTGTRYVRVMDHHDLGGPVVSEWDVLVRTRRSETPDPGAVLAAIAAKGAKPAGVRLWQDTYEATWATLEAAYPTWAGWDLAGSDRAGGWENLEETGAPL